MKSILFADFCRFFYCSTIHEFCVKVEEFEEEPDEQIAFALNHAFDVVEVEVTRGEARCFLYTFTAADGQQAVFSTDEDFFDPAAWDENIPKFITF